jgi:peptidoglycan/xylan/chitin deacetylase (PgdA/CDA1 family)
VWNSSRVPILCYHTVEDGWTSSLSLEPDAFDAHCRWLAEHREVVDLATATAALDRRDRLPGRTVALTFDDGLSGLYHHAMPILVRHRLPATIFVVAETLLPAGRPVDWGDGDPPPLEPLTLDQIREMAEAGISFGSHSFAHHDLTTLGLEACTDDLRRSREVLEDLLGGPVPHLAYPRGRHDADVRTAAERAGYEHAYSLPQGPEPTGRYAVPRVGVFGGNSLRTLRTKAQRWYPALRRSRAYATAQRLRGTPAGVAG